MLNNTDHEGHGHEYEMKEVAHDDHGHRKRSGHEGSEPHGHEEEGAHPEEHHEEEEHLDGEHPEDLHHESHEEEEHEHHEDEHHEEEEHHEHHDEEHEGHHEEEHEDHHEDETEHAHDEDNHDDHTCESAHDEFEHFDADHSGSLSESEMSSAFGEWIGIQMYSDDCDPFNYLGESLTSRFSDELFGSMEAEKEIFHALVNGILPLSSAGAHESEDAHASHEDEHEGHNHRKRQNPLTDCIDLNEMYDAFAPLSHRSLALATVYVNILKENGQCVVESSGDTNSLIGEEDEYCESVGARWAAMFGAVLVISLLSLLGLASIPLESGVFKFILRSPALAFAVGTLLGDAVLHLLPTAFGIHGHDSHGESAEPLTHAEEKAQYLWPACVVLLGVFAFFILERHIEHLHGPNDHHHHHHNENESNQHSCHNPAHGHDDLASLKNGNSLVVAPKKPKGGAARRRRSSQRNRSNDGSLPSRSKRSGGRKSNGAKFAKDGNLALVNETPLVESPPPAPENGEKCQENNSVLAVGYLNLTSDAIHNFVDGIAIGASFSSSMQLGLATTVAVFCHELPQEVGDFFILLHAGFTRTRALLFNFMCALFAVLGGIIGMALGSFFEQAERWVLAVTAGAFLYISLADMVQTLHNERGVMHSVVQSLCMLSGFGIMLGLSFLEEVPFFSSGSSAEIC